MPGAKESPDSLGAGRGLREAKRVGGFIFRSRLAFLFGLCLPAASPQPKQERTPEAEPLAWQVRGRAHDRVYGCEPLALIARGLPSLISS